MARATTKKSTAVAKKAKGGALADPSMFEEIAGMGLEKVTAKDLVIPRLTILQQMSPQLNKTKPEYIKGAESGNFVNVATGTVYEDEIQIIPCFYEMNYLEWKPRKAGGGLARIHKDESILDDCEEVEDDEGRVRWTTPSGNHVVETATWNVMVVEPDGGFTKAFIPMSMTQLKNSRKWMTAITGERIQGSRGPIQAPLFYRSWIASPAQESNNEGDWFGWRIVAGEASLEIDPTGALAQECVDYHNQLASGTAKSDLASMDDNAGVSVHDDDGDM